MNPTPTGRRAPAAADRSLPGRPLGRYVVGLVLIGLLAAVGTMATARAFDAQRGDAVLMQRAAEQASLARRLATLTVVLGDAASGGDTPVEMESIVDRLEQGWQELVGADAVRRLPDPFGSAVVERLTALAPSFSAIVDAAAETTAALRDGRLVPEATARRLAGEAGVFAAGMDSVVAEVRSAAEARVAAARRDQYLLLSALVVLLVLEGLFLFRPAVRRLRRRWAEREGALERELDAEELTYLARYDPLTGLINRTLFADRLQGAVARARRDGGLVAVMFLDIDGFKDVNDRHGHTVGDALLRQIAQRLVGTVRESDTVARLGGDEFTVILEGGHRVEDAGRVAMKLLDAVAAPYRVADHDLEVTTSVGIAIYPVDGEDPDELLRAADLAMYSAKASGRNTYQYFTSELRERTDARLALIDGLRAALEEDRGLSVVYEPIVDVARGRLVSLEASVRWEHPGLGEIPPERFLQVAEETDLVLPLGEWLLERVCERARVWVDEGWLTRATVGVDVAFRHLRHGNVVERIGTALAVAGVPARHLSVEVHETALAADLELTRRSLERLRDLGVRTVIDGFGTGEVSLGSLPEVPVDAIKVDRSFVVGLPDDPLSAAVVAAAAGLARSLGVEVVARGVERDDQVAFLEAVGCTVVQGPVVAPPLAEDEVASFLKGVVGLRRGDSADRGRGHPQGPVDDRPVDDVEATSA